MPIGTFGSHPVAAPGDGSARRAWRSPSSPAGARPDRAAIGLRAARRRRPKRARKQRQKWTADSVFRLFPRSWARHSVAVCQNEFLNSFPRIDFDSVDVGSIIHFDGIDPVELSSHSAVEQDARRTRPLSESRFLEADTQSVPGSLA